jgi:hypothetical protein
MATRKSPSAKLPLPLLPCNHDRTLYRMSTEGAWCTICNSAGPPFRDAGNPLGKAEPYAGVSSEKRGALSQETYANARTPDPADPVERLLVEQAAEGERVVRHASDDLRYVVRGEQGQMTHAILEQLREDLKREREAWIVENNIVRIEDEVSDDSVISFDRLLYAGTDSSRIWPTAMNARFAGEAKRVPWLLAKSVSLSALIALALVLAAQYFVHVSTPALPVPAPSIPSVRAPEAAPAAPDDKPVPPTKLTAQFHGHVLEVQVLTDACWLTVTEVTPAATVLVDRRVPLDYKRTFSFDEAASLEVRAGCPGQLLYWLNGEHYAPPNESGKPEESEVVNIRL